MPLRLRRLVQVLVLAGFPALGFLYAWQFRGQKRELIVPFKSFRAPTLEVSAAGKAEQRVQLPLRPGVTLVNFWATWCPPCVEEFPAMLELQRQLEDKGVHVLFVSIDEKWELVENFLKNYSLRVAPERLFWDPTKAGAIAWGSVKFPESYVLRPDGWVVEKIVGAQQWTRPSVLRYFEELGQRYLTLQPVASLEQLFLSSAWAEEPPAKVDAGVPATLIHEDDKKALENLRKNIETASGNLAKAEAAVKQEERNLREQELQLKRKKEELQEAEGEAQKLKAKAQELHVQTQKQDGLRKAEDNEKLRVEGQIKALETRIQQIQKQLEATKEQLAQSNKDLNTRIQSLGTAQQAVESLKEEGQGVAKRLQEAEKLRAERQGALRGAEGELVARRRKLAELQTEEKKAIGVLNEQKRKLVEFEKALQR